MSRAEQWFAVVAIVGSIWIVGSSIARAVEKSADNIINTLIGRYRP